MLLSIVMPAFNEEDVLEATVEALCAHLNETNVPFELLIVDDASKDRTGTLSKELANVHPQIRPLHNAGPNGYGNAIKHGLSSATGDAIVVVTSDGSDAPEDVEAYYRQIEAGYDCAFGSRFDGRANVTGYPPIKRVINRIANTLLGWIVGSSYRDFTNGFKCYRRHVIEDMHPIVSGQFNITIEMSLKATLGRYSYAVVPTDWHQREAGESSFQVLKLIRPYAATMLYCLNLNYLKNLTR